VAKSPAELIRDLTVQVGVLSERDATRRAELEGLKARLQQEIDERKTAEVKSREELSQLRRDWPKLDRRMRFLNSNFWITSSAPTSPRAGGGH
jgi:hypothetical protein